jgi:phospholipid/cholesterol/gamma-HCH transport system permease protein
MTILLAARAGAAVSADVATRVAGRQTDAMRTLSAPPDRYLLTGILWGFLLGTPLLAVVAFLGARAASALVFAIMAPDLSLWAWDGMFHRLITETGTILPLGTDWVLGKDLVCALGIALVAWTSGSRTKESPEAVARTVTATVIRGTIFVLVVHAAFALAEF